MISLDLDRVPVSEPPEVHRRRIISIGSFHPSIGLLLVIATMFLVAFVVFIAFGANYGASFLRVNDPQPADIILVLGGGMDDSRYWRGVELMELGYADKMVVDAEAGGAKYGKSNADLAGDFLKQIKARNTAVCPVLADSTYGEVEDVARCLAPLKARSVLIVTSDYHTRRAFSIFQARLPHYQWSIAGAYAPYEDGKTAVRMPSDKWWANRRWAKTILEEWQKLIWWEMVDRWKPHLVVQS